METDDPFEEQMRAWVRNLPRRDPTAPMKSQILSAAQSAQQQPSGIFPRRLVCAWVAMWIVALLFRLTAPENNIPAGPMLAPVMEDGAVQLFASLLP